MWTWNAGGAKGTWASLNVIAAHKPQMVFLQETGMRKPEAEGFVSIAQKQGYNGYFAEAKSDSARAHGGAMLVVKKTLHSRSAWAHAARGGAAVAAFIGGVLLISAYLAPVPEATEMANEVAAVVLSVPRSTRWCIAGDFNLTPESNTLQEALAGLGTSVTFPQGPTRWDGDRCIDYYISNFPLQNVRTLQYKLSDHKFVAAQWQEQLEEYKKQVLSPAPVLPQPQEDVSGDAWTKAITKAWARCQPSLQNTKDVDVAWRALGGAFFAALLEAHKAIGTPCDKMPSPGRCRKGKPQEAQVVTQVEGHRNPDGNQASFKQRTLSRLLGRMLEFRDRRNADVSSEASREQTRALESKIRRSPRYNHDLSLTANILEVEGKLKSHCEEENKRRLQKWKHKMRVDTNAYKWLRKQTDNLTHAVKCGKEDTAAANTQQALKKLEVYWQRIWKRERLSIPDTWRVLERELPQRANGPT